MALRLPHPLARIFPTVRHVSIAALASFAGSASFGSTQFLFDGSNDGWKNQSSEPFLAQYGPRVGLLGGGLLISATTPRDSFQLVHDADADWPVVPALPAAVLFDIRPAPGVALDFRLTGVLIQGTQGLSSVYVPAAISPLGNGWLRVQLAESDVHVLPGTHADTGINLHIGIALPLSSAPVAWLDNVAFVSQGSSPPPVPEPSKATLMGAALVVLGCLGLLRRRQDES